MVVTPTENALNSFGDVRERTYNYIIAWGRSAPQRMLVGACWLFYLFRGWRSSESKRIVVGLERLFYDRVFWARFVQDVLKERFLPRQGGD